MSNTLIIAGLVVLLIAFGFLVRCIWKSRRRGLAVAMFPLVAVMAPAVLSDCDYDGHPQTGVGIIDRRQQPESITFGVWGGSGYVAAEAVCGGGNGDWTVLAESGDYGFGGGGSSYSPAWWITVWCPWYKPVVLNGYAFSWG
jgi:hypothetical protein